jgi:hypothetical protein
MPSAGTSDAQCVSGLDARGQQVLEDVWSDLVADSPESDTAVELSWQQSERLALEDYV